MPYDAYLEFPEASGQGLVVKGETTDADFKAKGAMEIYSFSLGASNPVTIGSASTGSGGGKVSLSSLNVMKKSDNASSPLFTACCKGDHFPKAILTLRKAGGKQVEFLKYTLEKVFVESIQWSGSSGGDETPTESLSLAFGKYTSEYTAQDKDGKPITPAKKASWNQTTNTPD